MAAKRIPAKLVVVVVLLGLSAVVELLGVSVVFAGISVALMVGVLVGNDGVRTFLRALAAIEAVWRIFGLLVVASMSVHGAWLAFGLLGVGIDLFTIWALGRDDVRDWMFRKNFHIDEPT